MRPIVLAVAVLCPWLVFAADSKILIDNAYITVPPSSAPVSAAFMTIRNEGSQAKKLIGGTTDYASHVELHTHSMDDGKMQMRKVEEVIIQPGETVEFEPGGLHIMLIDLKKDLEAGSNAVIKLQFDDGQAIDQPFSIKTRN